MLYAKVIFIEVFYTMILTLIYLSLQYIDFIKDLNEVIKGFGLMMTISYLYEFSFNSGASYNPWLAMSV